MSVRICIQPVIGIPLVCFFVCLTVAEGRAAEAADPGFERDVAPILIDHCLECHSGSEPKGKLDLTDRSRLLKGGESGAALVPGQIDNSLLWERIVADEMPPKNPLSDQQKQILKRWIIGGAAWGPKPIDRFSTTTASRAGADWWALQPLRRPDVPHIDEQHPRRNPIDAFVQRKLRERGLAPSDTATPRELIRRLHIDLLGLPPSPRAVADFEMAMGQDHDAALRQLVEQLLNSHHFGERWGRHWLDVVRFGESQGFERDKLRTNSWYYRDWVIHAFNNDLPYDEFVRQQIAGDLLNPDDPNSVIATGFLVAGPWDEVGQSQRSKAMKAVVRQDEIEDYVGTIAQTFLGLTVNCARCHDHKFDPILQQEYYRMAAAVGGVHHGSRNVSFPESRDRRQQIEQTLRSHRKDIDQLDSIVRNRLVKQAEAAADALPLRVSPIARWDFEHEVNDKIGNLHAVQHPQARIADGRLVLDGGTGYAATHPVDLSLREKTLEAWVRLDDLDQRAGAAISIHSKNNAFDAIVFGEREPKKWMAGSEFFKRTKNLDAAAESAASHEFVHVAIAYHSDGTIACYRNGRPYGSPYKSTGPAEFRRGEWYVMFGLRTGGPDASRQLRGALETAQLYDRALTAEEVSASWECEKTAITHDQILAALTPSERKRRDELRAQMAAAEQESKKHQPFSIYAVSPTAADEVFVLDRGNPAQPREPVTAGGVAAVAGVTADFGLPADAPDSDRRRKLAQWITSKNNALFARVIVNRLWHYHFGVGLVPTPNDFGFNGGRPSHPELLDWLAAELIESGFSLKHVHRLIVSSATYLQSSRFRPECAAVDAGNRLLWRKSPLRLEAEALRDSVLMVSGQLNPQLGGAPYQDFTTITNNSQFYTMTDPDSPEVYRRTVYRTWIRSGRNHLLDAFDCPDPSTTAPKRAVTTTPIQSLTLMNGSFVLRMSQRFADRVTKEAGADTGAQVRRVYELALSRLPDDSEKQTGLKFVDEFGLPAFCRVVFNSNEFIYVD